MKRNQTPYILTFSSFVVCINKPSLKVIKAVLKITPLVHCFIVTNKSATAQQNFSSTHTRTHAHTRAHHFILLFNDQEHDWHFFKIIMKTIDTDIIKSFLAYIYNSRFNNQNQFKLYEIRLSILVYDFKWYFVNED